MTLEDLKAVLEQTGLPVAYRAWETPQALPYICYLTPYTNNLMADNSVYAKIDHVYVELYTAHKDLTLQQRLEDVLASAGLPWQSDETYIDSERCYKILYEIEV